MPYKEAYNPYKLSRSGSIGSKRPVINRSDSAKSIKGGFGGKVSNSFKNASKSLGGKKCDCNFDCDCKCVGGKCVSISIFVFVLLVILALLSVYSYFRFGTNDYGRIQVLQYEKEMKYPRVY